MLSNRRLTMFIMLLIAIFNMSLSSYATNTVSFVSGNLFSDRNFDGFMNDDELNISGIKLSLMQGEQEIQNLSLLPIPTAAPHPFR